MKKKGLFIQIFMTILFFTGCGNINGDIIKGNAGDKNVESNSTAQIVDFKWNHNGVEQEPYYIVRSDEFGSRWLVRSDDENPDQVEMSSVLSDSSDLKAFSDSLIAAGIMKWDGFSMSCSLGRYVQDESFSLEINFSDGKTLFANGLNAFPENYNEITAIIRDTFKAHEDYSRYYLTGWPDGGRLSDLMISVGLPVVFPNVYDEQFKIDYNCTKRQLTVTLLDPNGRYLDKGTYINKFVVNTETMPNYMGLLDKYDFFALNGQTEGFYSEKGDQYLKICGYYNDGSCLEVMKTINENDYKDFITEFIIMTYECVKMEVAM